MVSTCISFFQFMKTEIFSNLAYFLLM
uniref:Uncharacterized protein n=1 Tax=Rhizophora mucronata TaxID=61149 RepID=A0A2P2NQT9_RHIMU